jgi:[ribosomal protein S5]-alanine N-acetyltransferase
VIRPLVPGDAEELAELYVANRAFLAPFEPDRPDDFYTAAGQRQRLERSEADAADGIGWRFAIVDDGAIAGTINLNDVIRGPLQLANVGYWVDRDRNGRGLASAAVADVVEFAFGEAGLHRLEAGTLPDNAASQRVLAKNGFERFGYARQLLLIAGEWRDHVLFERIAD